MQIPGLLGYWDLDNPVIETAVVSSGDSWIV